MSLKEVEYAECKQCSALVPASGGRYQEQDYQRGVQSGTGPAQRGQALRTVPVSYTHLMATKESMEALKTQMGLNDPAIIQYFRWLAAMLQGNLGISYRNSLPVLGQVLEKLGPTLILTLSSTVLSVLIAVPLGIMSAYKPYSAWDYASSGFAFVGASTPTFFTGLVMIYIFAVKLRVLPMGGMYDAGVHTVASAVNHLIPVSYTHLPGIPWP